MTEYLPQTLPPQHAGIGLRYPHVAEIMERLPSVGWLEVHAENYMHEGTAVEALERLRQALFADLEPAPEEAVAPTQTALKGFEDEADEQE